MTPALGPTICAVQKRPARFPFFTVGSRFACARMSNRYCTRIRHFVDSGPAMAVNYLSEKLAQTHKHNKGTLVTV